MNLSATIITFNEQKNIARAIKSLEFVDEIIVIDSGSSDATCEIAQKLGALVFHNPFTGYGQQKNFAARKATNDWILSIDADEEITAELKQSITDLLNNEKISPVYFINRRTAFCNKWIYHGGWYPDHLARIYNRQEASWTEPYVHEELKAHTPSNKKITLKGHLNHHSFPTCESQIKTNIKYAKLGADQLLKKNKKIALIRVLTKPLGKFVECYFFKRGFLDGKAGLIIAINASYSIFMKYLFAWDQND